MVKNGLKCTFIAQIGGIEMPEKGNLRTLFCALFHVAVTSEDWHIEHLPHDLARSKTPLDSSFLRHLPAAAQIVLSLK